MTDADFLRRVMSRAVLAEMVVKLRAELEEAQTEVRHYEKLCRVQDAADRLTKALSKKATTPEERAVLEACLLIPESELHSSGNWYGWAKPIGEAVRALRESLK